MKYITAIFLVILISLFAFSPSFNLAVFGDFWVGLWRYERMVGRFSIGVWNTFTYFFTLYGPQDILTGIQFKIFGYESFPYYLTSYIFRLFAAFTFYPLTYFLTRNKFAAFFAVLFFSVTVIGAETTDWVFNMPSYLVIAFLNLFLFFFLKARNKLQIKSIIIFSILFIISLISSPIRSVGIVPLIITIEAIWLAKERNLLVLKQVIVRIGIILAIFLFILTKTTTFSTPDDWDKQTISPSSQGVITQIINGYKLGYAMLKNGQSDFLFNPLATVGGIFIPNLSSSNKSLSAWTGFTIILLWIMLLIVNRKKSTADILAISLSGMLLTILIPWVKDLNSIYPTVQRYLIISAVSVSLFYASILSIFREKSSKNIVFIILIVFLTLNIYSTRVYFKNLESIRNQKLYDKIWSQLGNININKTSEPLLFYFDGERSDIIFNVLTFGFPSKIQLLYNVPNYKSVVTVISYDEILSATTDGKSLTKFGLPQKPISVENIYTFTLQDKDYLINTSETTRQKLTKNKSGGL